MRCKCCNRLLSDEEMMSLNPSTLEPEDMCNTCLDKSGVLHVEDDTHDPNSMGALDHSDMMVGIQSTYPGDKPPSYD